MRGGGWAAEGGGQPAGAAEEVRNSRRNPPWRLVDGRVDGEEPITNRRNPPWRIEGPSDMHLGHCMDRHDALFVPVLRLSRSRCSGPGDQAMAGVTSDLLDREEVSGAI